MKKTLVYILICAFVFVAAGCSFGSHAQPSIVPGGPTSAGKETGTPMATPTAKATSAPSATPTQKADKTPTPTEKTTEAPSETPTPTSTPTPTPFSPEECRDAVVKAVGSAYTVSVGSEETVSGVKLFVFSASQNELAVPPELAVNPADKSIFYYYRSSGELAPFETFPIDNGEKIDPSQPLTRNEVLLILASIPIDRLGYSGELAACTFDIASGFTKPGDEQPYYHVYMLLNTKTMGVFWISEDKTTVFRQDAEELLLIK